MIGVYVDFIRSAPYRTWLYVLVTGSLIFSSNLANVAAFVSMVTFIKGGDQRLDFLQVDSSFFIFISAFFLVVSSFLYSFQKNALMSIKDSVKEWGASIKGRIYEDFCSGSKDNKNLFCTAVAPQALVVCLSCLTITIISIPFGLFIILSISGITLIFLKLIKIIPPPKSKNKTTKLGSLVISLLSASALILPAIYLATLTSKEGEGGTDAVLLVFIILLIRYVYSSYRGILFTLYRMRSNDTQAEDEISYGDKSYLNVINGASFTSEKGFCKLLSGYSNNTIPFNIKEVEINIDNKKIKGFSFFGKVVVSHKQIRGFARSQILKFIREAGRDYLFVYPDEKFVEKYFGVALNEEHSSTKL